MTRRSMENFPPLWSPNEDGKPYLYIYHQSMSKY